MGLSVLLERGLSGRGVCLGRPGRGVSLIGLSLWGASEFGVDDVYFVFEVGDVGFEAVNVVLEIAEH